MPYEPFFNAHHSPVGAFASFTLGYKGASGGLGIELGKPADENMYIGLETEEGGTYQAFPFFGDTEEDLARFAVGNDQTEGDQSLITHFSDEEIQRDFNAGTDTWRAGDLEFTIYSPVREIPDPEGGNVQNLKDTIVPAVFVEVTIDNRNHAKKRKAFFGYQGEDPYSGMRRITSSGIQGIGQGRRTAIVTNDAAAKAGLGFTIDKVLNVEHEFNLGFGLGLCGAIVIEAEANEKKTFQLAVCFYRDGYVTSGIDTTYYYTQYFSSIEEVAAYALDRFQPLIDHCRSGNQLVDGQKLTDEQRFMMAHSIKSYYGNTQFLENNGKPLWVVNEGEYRMMNTFDLTVDQLFYELKMSPWTVKNVLEQFTDRYSYKDTVFFPETKEQHPGGISFTHDMGVANVFSDPGRSAYEFAGIDDCFSFMTHEELVNWLCCASVYVSQTGDEAFAVKHKEVLVEAFNSMLHRDHPEPEQRNGLMGLDSSYTKGGAEITTYDSLDVSLGQARNNIYLAVKCWGVYAALEKLFQKLELSDLSREAGRQLRSCAETITSEMTEEGYIPAVITEGNTSRIIPAIEGLIFPYFTDCKEYLKEEGEFGTFIQALKKHIENVLKPGVCLFEDGGWKISSTSDNSWLSKIYLCQFIYREILEFPWGEQEKAADQAHVKWLTHPKLSYWSWSDQIIAGEISASRYYPRGVTSILWLLEK
ncbi:glycoside hydrolase family 52 protein [Halobacillus salinarum]|uniref:Glycoside hydrolase family 52 protein n=1 Tax=Halobacillus salinarum TaxID=2932257 RepID=A0ABY4EHT3_9BACI|nr:glycoside hydrolase family 52 protein [Halobacillus salinarum]UOQ44033.1 glycoside hydrolase family 52 protein [Halobacillus salinarum]